MFQSLTFTLLCASLAAACTQPVMRTMRLEPGPEVSGGVELLIGGEGATHTSASNEGNSQTEDGAITFWPINLDGRWAWVNEEGFGVAVGAYLPGAFNQKISGSGSSCLPPLWMFTPYFQLGADRGPVAVSVGAEGGCGAGAAFGGLDLRLFDDDSWAISLSPAARLTIPWGPDATTPADQVPRGDSVEAGIALRVGGVFVQYWHEWNEGPARKFEQPSGSLEAQTWHTITLGLSLNINRLSGARPQSVREAPPMRRVQ